ncbi:MAG: hypothetical protein PVJ90_03025 [Pseudomonadales bacterium]|jgi:hypothetical protein
MSTLHLIMTPEGLTQAIPNIQAEDNVILFDQEPCSINCSNAWTSYLTQPGLASNSDGDLNADQVAEKIVQADRIESW